MNKTYRFYPRNKQFWLYHGILLAVVSVVQLIVFLSIGKNVALNLTIQLLWLPFYTAAVLSFRYCYRVREWCSKNMAKLIPSILGVSLVSAISISFIILALIFPFYGAELFSTEVLAKQGITLISRLASFIFGNSVISFLFIAAWAFVYVAVTTNRKVIESEIKQLKLESSLKEAKLSSLTSQLNPHFLFNSLNNIRFMIHENATHADEMITAFSEILRYSLASSQQQKVLLEQELEIVNRYIDIMRLQLGDRLDVRLHCSAECKRYLIPPMIIQMLVENAVKHGIENTKGEAVMSIDIVDENDSLKITVENPICSANVGQSTGEGIGLKNIEQRLNLLYGDSKNLIVNKTSDIYFVTLLLPKEASS